MTPRAVRSEGRAGDSSDLVVLTATRDMITGIWNVELYERRVARLVIVCVTNIANTPLDISSQTVQYNTQHSLYCQKTMIYNFAADSMGLSLPETRIVVVVIVLLADTPLDISSQTVHTTCSIQHYK